MRKQTRVEQDFETAQASFEWIIDYIIENLVSTAYSRLKIEVLEKAEPRAGKDHTIYEYIYFTAMISWLSVE